MAQLIGRGFDSRRIIDISIEELGDTGRVLGAVKLKLKNAEVMRLLREAIDDIGDAVEERAKEEAPRNKDPDAYTWRRRTGPPLKEHPVDRDSNRRVPGSPSHEVIRQEITVAENPHYAVFVHEGTFAHGPTSAKAMRYKSFGTWYIRKWVRGQDPNPYLTRAFFYVDGTYVPIRVAALRAHIAAIT